MTDSITYLVDPCRLERSPRESSKRSEEIGRRTPNVASGDIYSSYSGDIISSKSAVRKPFQWQGALWVAISLDWVGNNGRANAYRLTPKELFEGRATTYHAKVGTDAGAEGARQDPMGFHHGMTVTHEGKTFVLCGPKTTFLADASAVQQLAQLDLF